MWLILLRFLPLIVTWFVRRPQVSGQPLLDRQGKRTDRYANHRSHQNIQRVMNTDIDPQIPDKQYDENCRPFKKPPAMDQEHRRNG